MESEKARCTRILLGIACCVMDHFKCLIRLVDRTDTKKGLMEAN